MADSEEVTAAIARTCRFYENEFPEANEIVAVVVNEVEDLGAYVSLLEYGGISGMILASEVSRKKNRQMKNMIRVGKIETCVVLRVDREKGFIDLSKRRVNEDDIQFCQDRYNNAKVVHSIMARVSSLTNVELEDLYIKFGWPLYEEHEHAYFAFNRIVNGETSLLDKYNLDASIKDAFINVLKHRLTPRPSVIRATIELTCFGSAGVDGLKEALRAGLTCSTEAIPLKIRLLTPPNYIITTLSTQQPEAIKAIENAIEAIREVIIAKEGTLVVTEAARVASDKDDVTKQIAKLKQKLEETQRENDDEDEDDEDDEE